MTDSRAPTSLLALRTFYFLCFGALGCLFPFLPLMLSKRGLGASEIGWVMVVIPLGNLAIPPLWAAAADVLRARLPLLRAAAVGSGLTVLLLLPKLGFLASIGAVAAFSFFRAPLTSLADASSVDALGGRSHDFSRVRVWGSVGFAVFVSLLGWLEASSHPTLLLICGAAIYLLAGAATLPLRGEHIRRQPGVAFAIGRVLRRGSVIAFLLSTALYYLGHAIYDTYFGLHAQALHLGDGFVGSAWTVGVGTEIVLLLLAPRFLHRIRTQHMLIACAGIATLRWLGLAHLTSAAGLIALQPLHGITFGLWYLSLVSFVQTRADKRTRTTLQSIALSCVAFGMAGGYLAGGWIFEHHGSAFLYRLAAGAAFLAMLGYAVTAGLVRNRAAGNPTLPPHEPSLHAGQGTQRACSNTSSCSHPPNPNSVQSNVRGSPSRQ